MSVQETRPVAPAQGEKTVTEGQAPDEQVPGAQSDPLVDADLLVEDVSIDGMCGVY